MPGEHGHGEVDEHGLPPLPSYGQMMRLPPHSRDVCAAILIPLNKCRRENFFLPWHCEHERHSYEVCLFKDFERRKKLKQEERAAQKANESR